MDCEQQKSSETEGNNEKKSSVVRAVDLPVPAGGRSSSSAETSGVATQSVAARLPQRSQRRRQVRRRRPNLEATFHSGRSRTLWWSPQSTRRLQTIADHERTTAFQLWHPLSEAS